MPSSADSDVSMARLVQRVLRRLRGVLFVGGALVLLYVLQDVAKLLLVAALIAYILNPLVSRLQRRMSRTAATLLVFSGVLVAVGGGSVLLGPVVQSEVQEMRAAVEPGQVERVVEQIDQRISAVLTRLGGDGVNLKQRLQRKVSQFGQGLVGGVSGLLNAATNVVLIPFLAVFLLRDGPRIKRGLIRFVPNRYFEFSLEALHKIDQQLGNYLRGLVLEILIISGLSMGALWLLDVQSFVLLGGLAGVTTVIPYLGSLLGGSVAVLLTLASTGSASAAALVFLAFLLIQVADEAVIQPLVFAQAVDLHPLEVLLAVWVAAQFFGVVAMVLAVPVTSAAKVVVTEGAALIQQYQFS